MNIPISLNCGYKMFGNHLLFSTFCWEMFPYTEIHVVLKDSKVYEWKNHKFNKEIST